MLLAAKDNLRSFVVLSERVTLYPSLPAAANNSESFNAVDPTTSTLIVNADWAYKPFSLVLEPVFERVISLTGVALLAVLV